MHPLFKYNLTSLLRYYYVDGFVCFTGHIRLEIYLHKFCSRLHHAFIGTSVKFSVELDNATLIHLLGE
jgi:hypothetical protein